MAAAWNFCREASKLVIRRPRRIFSFRTGRLNSMEALIAPATQRFCAEPFNCQTYDGPQGVIICATIMKDGRPNLHSWCALPQYEEYVSQCVVKKDLMKAARTMYENTKAGKHGKDTFQMDGSLCFIEGHCLNQEVHEDSTLDEAAAQCDGRFGRAEWTSLGYPQSQASTAFINYASKISKLNQSNGFPSQEYARGYTLLACAMGTYHCDIML
eukprot:TRINITY_DN6683_c0_g1_i2.p1 TRINITY_DN6683_c0_g1~~TRINITY_DN6683_c0_g1_i2.p1  ORF type:complete len:213 (+),score=25.50 TRINITY_DN6683_c0_g1_i2:166-804(+)